MSTRLAVVMSGFPRTSETFAVGELTALARAGMLARIYATKAGDGAPPQPGVRALLPWVHWLPEGDADAQAAALVRDAAGVRIDGVHGYFGHRPAEVAAAAAHRLGVGYSFSVHALDARKVPPVELAARARAATGVVACNTDVARHVDVAGATVRLLPHGVDLDRFPAQPRPPDDGRLRLLAVGRLVEKKGFDVLLEAVARLRVPWTLRVVGSGPQRALLEDAVERLRIGATVELVGAVSHVVLPAEYARADVVVVPSVIDSQGDRDGLPNVLLEAMASERPVVASEVAALGGAVRAARGGIPVPAGVPDALATALTALADPQRRARYAAAGRRHVVAHHDLGACTDRLVGHLAALHDRAVVSVDA